MVLTDKQKQIAITAYTNAARILAVTRVQAEHIYAAVEAVLAEQASAAEQPDARAWNIVWDLAHRDKVIWAGIDSAMARLIEEAQGLLMQPDAEQGQVTCPSCLDGSHGRFSQPAQPPVANFRQTHDWKLKRGWKQFYECSRCLVSDIDPRAELQCTHAAQPPAGADHASALRQRDERIAELEQAVRNYQNSSRAHFECGNGRELCDLCKEADALLEAK